MSYETDNHITYTWNLDRLQVVPSANGLSEIVKIVPWYITASDGETTVTINGVELLDPPDEGNFVSFENLQKDQVLEWVKTKMDEKAKIANSGERIAYNTLQKKKNPPLIQKFGPWVNSNDISLGERNS